MGTKNLTSADIHRMLTGNGRSFGFATAQLISGQLARVGFVLDATAIVTMARKIPGSDVRYGLEVQFPAHAQEQRAVQTRAHCYEWVCSNVAREIQPAMWSIVCGQLMLRQLANKWACPSNTTLQAWVSQTSVSAGA